MTTPSSRRVSSLKFTFLVDNCIEWMTKLPPGFTSEIGDHLFNQTPPVDERTGVPIVDLENYCCGAHGFSVLIETKAGDVADTHTTLFDTGPDSRALLRNIHAMQTPVEKIERVIISHWHADHTGGLRALLKHRELTGTMRPPPIVVDAHPDRPLARGIAPPPTHDRVIGRLPPDPTFDEITALGGVVEAHSEPHVVAGGTVYVSGAIPRVTPFEGGLLGGMRWVEDVAGQGTWVKEPHIMDERYAAVDVLGKGLVIFSACSHAGIVNVVKDAIAHFERPVYMVVGGLHLAGPELQPRIAPTVDFLAHRMRPSCTYVLPMHCSGFAAKVALEAALGEGCVPAGVGITVRISGDAAAEEWVHPPTIA